MKRYRVDYSDDAEDDLHAIGLYLAAEASVPVAQRFVEELIARCEKLATYPGRGARRHDAAHPGAFSVLARLADWRN